MSAPPLVVAGDSLDLLHLRLSLDLKAMVGSDICEGRMPSNLIGLKRRLRLRLLGPAQLGQDDREAAVEALPVRGEVKGLPACLLRLVVLAC